MNTVNVLLLCGGGGSEHDISLISAEHIYNSLKNIEDFQVFQIEICKDGQRKDQNGDLCELRKSGEIFYPESNKTVYLHFAIPCIHGPPGESGEIQGIFEMMGLPYLGTRGEASILCFNKLSTKLYFDALNIPNTPYLFLWDENQTELAFETLKDWGTVFVKATNQGSSIGCYKVTNKDQLAKVLPHAFELSPYVLLEKAVSARELEVSAYESNGQLVVTGPGEILCPDGFYTYEEKYNNESHTDTAVTAQGLSPEQVDQIKSMASKAFKALKLRDLSRIDFFLCEDGTIYLNEINTFPGMTPISMFPKMMENRGDSFKDWLNEIIQKRRRQQKNKL